jgi:acetyltransferase-like isoleucine patch superfamily enzyme
MQTPSADPATGHTGGEIIIWDDVWIAASVVVTADVIVGKGAVVAAGALVHEGRRAVAVVAGVPAQPVAVRRGLNGHEVMGMQEPADVERIA